MKKDRAQVLFLEQLAKLPIISIAAEKAGIARRTVYNWREDPEFAKKMDAAIEEGEALLNDLGESQLVSLMRDRKWPAISFWLRHRNPKFKDKLEISGRIEQVKELPPEQKEALKKQFGLIGIEIKDHGKQ